MSSKHTPGPWRIVPIMRGKYRGDIGLAPSHELDPVFCYLAKGRDDIQEANARLIAAAPELLATLDQIARLAREADRSLLDVASMLGDIARAAVAKAIQA